jgi:hypothetical protein
MALQKKTYTAVSTLHSKTGCNTLNMMPWSVVDEAAETVMQAQAVAQIIKEYPSRAII